MNILSTEASLSQDLQEALPGEYHALLVKGLAFDVADDRIPAGAGNCRRYPGPRHGAVPSLLSRSVAEPPPVRPR